jgi:hypothetical protein
MGDLDKLLSVAKAEIGTKENPANSNKVKYNTWYYGKEVSGDNYAWCSVFVLWCFDQAKIGALAFGATLQAVRNTKMWPKGTRVWRTLAEKLGQWVASGYKSGDIVVFDWDKSGTIDHVGIVESVSADGKTLTTIEGNTLAGSNSNGGEVQLRQRAVGQTVVGAFRPKYAVAAPTAQASSPTAQQVIDRMAADGVTSDKAHWSAENPRPHRDAVCPPWGLSAC